MTKNTSTATPRAGTSEAGRYIIIGLLVVAAFFASYRFAAARSVSSASSGAGATAARGQGSGILGAGTNSAGSGGSSPACACCGGGSGSSTPIEGSATVEGDVQRITVDTSSGSYNPNVIKLKAGVPAEITFGQAGGCLAQVVSEDLGFNEDLTTGDKTVKLPALTPGTYGFSCGMQMVFGTIVVE